MNRLCRHLLSAGMFLSLTCLSRSAPLDAATSERIPLTSAHAHNDYSHTRPLLDALDQGFCSVEADIWLVDGELLVAHDREAVKPERTLDKLYLAPLRERVRRNGGSVFAAPAGFTLLIDLKSEAEPTYQVLARLLHSYSDILTSFSARGTTNRAVTVILSGNRPVGALAAQPVRLAGLDGRLPDLDTNPPPNLFPWISDNWQKHFTWNGEDQFLPAEATRLRAVVKRAHDQRRKIRFWAIPDNERGWAVMREAGVDLINTDRLAELRAFLQR